MKLYKWLYSIAVLIFFLGCASTKTVTRPQIGQQPHSFAKQIAKTVRVNSLLFIPKDYAKDKRSWPMLVFLHGAGEMGDNLELVKRNAPPKIVEEQKDFPFILLSPQCPQGEWWSPEILNLLLEEIVNQYRVDEDRIYLTGLSMGGFGTWNFAIEFPLKDSLSFMVYSDASIKAQNLPVVYFEDIRNWKTGKLNLSGHVSDFPAQQWVKVKISLQVFKRLAGPVDLSRTKTIFSARALRIASNIRSIWTTSKFLEGNGSLSIISLLSWVHPPQPVQEPLI